MRHTLLLLLGLSLSLSNTFASSTNKTDRHGRKQGAWEKTYNNGNKMYEGEFKDDNPVGTFKRYYEDGKLKSTQVYKPKSDESEVTIYDTDGKTITTVGHYKGKVKDGEWKYYNEGKLTLVENYVNGKREGISKGYKNDAVIEEIPYKNDKIDGIRKAFLENGKIYSETEYKDGKMNGNYKLYEGQEQPIEEGSFKNGKRSGEWRSYDDKHKMIDKTSYSSDGKAVNQKEIDKKNSEQFDKNEEVVKNKKYKEPTEMMEGASVKSR